MLELPVNSDSPDFKANISLEDTQYIFRFRWNSRGEFWTMSISDQNEVMIRAGLPLRCGARYLRRLRHLALPPGEIFVFDTTQRSADPGIGDLGTRVLLLYATAEELSAAAIR